MLFFCIEWFYFVIDEPLVDFGALFGEFLGAYFASQFGEAGFGIGAGLALAFGLFVAALFEEFDVGDGITAFGNVFLHTDLCPADVLFMADGVVAVVVVDEDGIVKGAGEVVAEVGIVADREWRYA